MQSLYYDMSKKIKNVIGVYIVADSQRGPYCIPLSRSFTYTIYITLTVMVDE